jgi:hypothetical protein
MKIFFLYVTHAAAATIEDARNWADAITAALTAKTITEC